jgi:hypothetical protein
MSFLNDDELRRYRPRFMCALFKKVRGLVGKQTDADEVFEETGIRAFKNGESRATDSLIQDARQRGLIQKAHGRMIELTDFGFSWCKNVCTAD